MKTVEQCATLAEYRLEVMRAKQDDIARRARCAQAWISQIERGHLPKPWSRDEISKAYDLEDEDFVRLVQNAKAVQQLKKAETLPLWKYTVSSPTQVEHIDCMEKRKCAN
jgi:hypothetical protein